jgi:hypothetical protein
VIPSTIRLQPDATFWLQPLTLLENSDVVFCIPPSTFRLQRDAILFPLWKYLEHTDAVYGSHHRKFLSTQRRVFGCHPGHFSRYLLQFLCHLRRFACTLTPLLSALWTFQEDTDALFWKPPTTLRLHTDSIFGCLTGHFSRILSNFWVPPSIFRLHTDATF